MVASMVTKFFCEVVAVVATEEKVATVLTFCSSVVPVVVVEYCVDQCWSQICFA